MSFSEREGYKELRKNIQIKEIDEKLRISLWNLLIRFYFYDLGDRITSPPVRHLIQFIWTDSLYRPLDKTYVPLELLYKELREYYFSCTWNEVYDLLEFIANNVIEDFNIPVSGPMTTNEFFIKSCNQILERELSAYRFIKGIISPISSEIEFKEIDEVLEKSKPFNSIFTHLENAIILFSDRKNPDFRNSIKESISAVESLCKIITKNKKATLADALKLMEKDFNLHPALKEGFIKLYGYTSAADGIRHGLVSKPNLDFDDAKYFLVSCSAFVSYLISKYKS